MKMVNVFKALLGVAAAVAVVSICVNRIKTDDNVIDIPKEDVEVV